MRKNYLLIFALFLIIFQPAVNGQDKKPLTHADYDDWKTLENQQISNSGHWVSFEVNPQDGDGTLRLYDVQKNVFHSFKRGSGARISANDHFIAFAIKPQKDTVRQAKLDGKKKDELPADSLGIYLTDSDSLIRIAQIKSFKIPKEERAWIAYLLDKEKPSADTAEISDSVAAAGTKEPGKKKLKKKKKQGNTLVVFNPINGEEASYKHVTEYSFSEDGSLLTFISTRNDSIDSVYVHYLTYPGTRSDTIYSGPGYAMKITPDKTGKQLAYIFSADTGKIKVYDLRLRKIAENTTRVIVDTTSTPMPEGWCISENATPVFSENGMRLYFGTAAIPEKEPEDSLTEDEKVSVDIWNWKDDLLQPQQLKELENDKKKNYQAVYHIPKKTMVQLQEENLDRIAIDRKHPRPYALGFSGKPYRKYLSWDANRYHDVYLINIANGDKKLILEKLQSNASLSPLGRYVVYYEENDSSWNTYTVKSGEFHKLTKSLPVSFSYEEFDMPTDPGPYGIMGWTANDEMLLVYDRYDIWKLDPEGDKDPVNLSGGREQKMRFRYIRLDPEEVFIPLNKKLLLSAVNEETRQSGFYDLTIAKEPRLEKILLDDFHFQRPDKAKNAGLLIWNRMSFVEYPDLWISERDFSHPKKISEVNPQQDKYLWGSVELIQWPSADGAELEGLLYKPENFNPDSSYPMIVYFYEKYSNRLHSHYTPRPSRSTINFSYYASNGYLVFVPDIIYKTGYPGQSAYNAIVSGALHLLKHPWVDKDNIGIQGQSWGGYQVAWLITQTNMFAAAMAGAPVSNMTSAYGGIRWGSGMSRMFQYEGSQSRIGGTLWEKPLRYIENSPLFYADKVETPLLIMHNDNDGAVPWYQGIEYFVALRRLNKAVWMLTYNGAPHNLKRRADCKDLSIRMQQFFDHYLKGAPAPLWMEQGIPAIKKGKAMGYELIEP